MELDESRRSNGQFPKGKSGNPKGRPRKKIRHSIPDPNRRAIFRIAERVVPVTINGKTEELTLFEASVFQLGLQGAKGDKSAAKLFVEAVNRAAKENGDNHEFTRMLLQEVNDQRKVVEELVAERLRSGVIINPSLFERAKAIFEPLPPEEDGSPEETD
jgi:hypothetical protein